MPSFSSRVVCAKQLKAFDKVIKIAAAYRILSRASFQSSEILSKIVWHPCYFLNAHKQSFKIVSKYAYDCS